MRRVHQIHANALALAILLSIASLAYTGETIPPEEAWNLGWPTMQGPYGNFRVPQTGATLVDDLSKARLVWETEDKDFGRAKHTTGAFKGKTAQDRVRKILDILGPNPKATPGGWAAPIVAESKVFATTFKPAGKLYDVQALAYDEESRKNPMTAKAHLEANDLLIALDAKTGKTLWQASEPGGFIWGVGKRNGFQVAPAYHGGVIYSMGTTGRVFAYAANDGKKLWQTEPEAKMIEERNKHLAKSHVLQASARYAWQQSLVFAGDTLVVPRKTTLLGLNPANGKKKWELPKVISHWNTPTVWRHEKKEYLLCATGGKPGQAQLNLVDPVAGKVLWKVDGLHSTQFNLAPSENHVLVNVGSRIMKENPNGSSPKNTDGEAPFGLLGAYRITPKGATHAWSLPDKPHFLTPTWSDSLARLRTVIRDGYVYHTTGGPDKTTDRRFIIAKEDTGEVLVDEPRENDFWFQLIEDKLLHCIDWSHGSRASFNLYSADPKKFRKLSGPWKPEQPLTTSYQVLMEPPVIAGRIFWRTETGTIVCYDLRKVKR
jgi:outer membrane protein assembly factor BamB